MLILLGLIGWFLFGVLNVYLAGVIDRNIDAEAPVTVLFFSGPFGLLICAIVFIVCCSENQRNPLWKIYNLGRKEKYK